MRRLPLRHVRRQLAQSRQAFEFGQDPAARQTARGPLACAPARFSGRALLTPYRTARVCLRKSKRRSPAASGLRYATCARIDSSRLPKNDTSLLEFSHDLYQFQIDAGRGYFCAKQRFVRSNRRQTAQTRAAECRANRMSSVARVLFCDTESHIFSANWYLFAAHHSS
jgi:hypothetical protein